MAIIDEDVTLSCQVDGTDGMHFIRIDILNSGHHITSIEFADITDFFDELSEANEFTSIYENIEDLKTSIATAHLNKFLNKDYEDSKMEMILDMVAKMKHNHGKCSDGCTLCNPDVSGDVLPDFTFEVKKHEYNTEN